MIRITKYRFDVFEIAAAGFGITGATQANPCVITAVGHTFINGDRVKISGVGGMVELNGQIYTVAGVAGNNLSLNDDNGANINSGGYGAYGAGGTVYMATRLETAHSTRRFGAIGDIGAMSAGGVVSLTRNNTLETHVKGTTDATNLTVSGAQLSLHRV